MGSLVVSTKWDAPPVVALDDIVRGEVSGVPESMAHLDASTLLARDGRRPRKDPVPSLEGDSDLCRELQDFLGYCSRHVEPPTALAKVWEDFYERYSFRIGAFLRRYRLSEAERADCLQDVWSEVVAHLVDFPYDPRRGRLSTWLMTVARNRTVDAIRHRRRFATGLLTDAVELPDQDADPAAACDRHSARDRVQSALAELSDEVPALSYQVLYQRVIDGRTGAEVAETLGLTPEQVRFRLLRTKRKLRKLLQRSSGPHPDSGDTGPSQKGRIQQDRAQRAGASCE
jgi:RNA polymerase sigma-70 factor (ECF subfamily)